MMSGRLAWRAKGALAIATLLGACAPADAPDARATLGTARSPVQGGKVDRAHTFAVAVLSDGEVCSGALIAPNLVLTARHCVSPGGGDVVDCRTDTFGAPSRVESFQVTTDAVATDSSPYHAVSKILTPPSKKFCGNDIALLILADVVAPEEATPITPAVEHPMTDHPRYQTEVALIGYGITAPRENDEGTRRIRERVPLVCTPGDPLIPCSSLADYDITETEFVVKEGACTGDSGGSAIDQASLASAPVTFGVLSRAAETSTRCTEATYTRTDAFKDFLVAGAEEAALAGDYPKPLWAGGPDPLEADAGATDAEAPAPATTPSKTTTSGCSVAVGHAPASAISVLWLLVAIARRARRAPAPR